MARVVTQADERSVAPRYASLSIVETERTKGSERQDVTGAPQTARADLGR